MYLKEEEATEIYHKPQPQKTIFTEISSPIASAQVKNEINDYKRQPLLVNALFFHRSVHDQGVMSTVTALEDVFVGGDVHEAGALFIQRQNGKFIKNQEPFISNKESQDADALFLMPTATARQTLYVVSGGYGSFKDNDPLFQDRLYLNDGKGNLAKTAAALPEMHQSKSCVSTADFNGDGRPDLFVGGRNPDPDTLKPQKAIS